MRFTFSLATTCPRLIGSLVLFLLCWAPHVHAETATPEATAVVTELHNTLLEMMKNADQLGYSGRYEMIAPLVTTYFDIKLIAQVVLGRYWRTLDATKKAEFIALLTQLSIATYASRFTGFNGESFELSGSESAKRGRVLVKTELLRPDDAAVKLNYLLHHKEGRWRIVNVIANGVSDLSLKRGEYVSVMKENGYNGLLREITIKIREMADDSIASH